ncbi:heparan sulfate sulfotransferase-like, partial [Tropilaelaps mercedesae]
WVEGSGSMAYQQARRLFVLALSATCFVLLHVLLLQQQPMPPSPDYATHLSVSLPLADDSGDSLYVLPAQPHGVSMPPTGGAAAPGGRSAGARGDVAVLSVDVDSENGARDEPDGRHLLLHHPPQVEGSMGASGAASSRRSAPLSESDRPADDADVVGRSENSVNDAKPNASGNPAAQATPTLPLNESSPPSGPLQVGGFSTGAGEAPVMSATAGGDAGAEGLSTAENSSAPNSGQSIATAQTTTALPRAGGVKRLPQCIIIGARKGGTRALLEFLNLHPAIEKATDEVHFFDDDSKYRLGLDWYRTRMPPSTAEQMWLTHSTPKPKWQAEGHWRPQNFDTSA